MTMASCRSIWPAVGLALALAGAARAQDAPAGDAVRGRETFRAVGCWECHGTSGEGGGWQGPKVAPNPLPWTAFERQLREPRAQMPPYRGAVLSEAEAADLYAYLKSVPKGAPASQIPQLNH